MSRDYHYFLHSRERVGKRRIPGNIKAEISRKTRILLEALGTHNESIASSRRTRVPVTSRLYDRSGPSGARDDTLVIIRKGLGFRRSHGT